MMIYTDLVAEIIDDVAAKVPSLAHLRSEEIAVAAATRWAGSSWGNLAACIGLAADPRPTFSIWVRGRSREVVQVSRWYWRRPAEVHFGGRTSRYLILLRLPRLLEHNPLETIIHELYHVGERFDGGLRPLRHGRVFDWNVQRLMRRWLERAEAPLAELAQMRLEELRARAGALLARRLPLGFQPMLTLPAEPPCPYEEAMAAHYPRFRLARRFTVAPIAFTSDSAPRRITEADCTLRLYHSGGSEDLSPYAMRRLAGRIPLADARTPYAQNRGA
jgi:hypothetical protein